MGRGRRGNGREMYAKRDDEEEDAIVVTDEHGAVIEEDAADPVVVNAEEQDDPAAHQADDGADDAVALLERQLQEARSAREQESAQLRHYQERDAAAQQDRLATQRALLEHGIANAQSEIKLAKTKYAQAAQAGNFDEMADAQAEMAQASIEARNYELARDAFDNQVLAAQRQPQRSQQPANADPVEARIATLSDPSKDWVRKHRDDIFNGKDNGQREQRVYAGHLMAVSEGLKPDTPDYFTFLDRHMGYESEKPMKQPQQRRPAMPSAPVSRGSGVGGESIALTSEQRETAQRLGMKLSTYAKLMKKAEANGRLTAQQQGAQVRK